MRIVVVDPTAMLSQALANIGTWLVWLETCEPWRPNSSCGLKTGILLIRAERVASLAKRRSSVSQVRSNRWRVSSVRVSWLLGTPFPVVTASTTVRHEMPTNVEHSTSGYMHTRRGLGDRIQFESKSHSEHHMHLCATEPSALCEYSLHHRHV